VAYAVTAIPARAVLERGRWRDAARLKLSGALPSLQALTNHKWAIGTIYFAKAVGAARAGETRAARTEVSALAALEQSLVIPPGEYDWRKQIAIERQIADSWLAHAEHRDADAERIMRAAAELDDATEKHPVTPGSILPAREQLGALLLELNRPRESLREYEESLTRAPRRLAGLYGAARAAQRSGQTEAARRYYAELLEVTKYGSPALTEVKEAQAFTAKYARR
jgi:tetratricopeptide (TPR) repeat protein